MWNPTHNYDQRLPTSTQGTSNRRRHLLDFSKAFDTEPHNKLLHRLDQYGINFKGNTHKIMA